MATWNKSGQVPGCHHLAEHGLNSQKKPYWSPNEEQKRYDSIILTEYCGYFHVFLWKICGKDSSTLEVALFCFLGHRSNPSSMDQSLESFEFHDVRIFVTPVNPCL